MQIILNTSGEIEDDTLRDFVINAVRTWLLNNRLQNVWVRNDDDRPDPHDNPWILIQPDGILVDDVAIAGRTLAPIAELSSNDPDDVQTKINEIVEHVNKSRTGTL